MQINLILVPVRTEHGGTMAREMHAMLKIAQQWKTQRYTIVRYQDYNENMKRMGALGRRILCKKKKECKHLKGKTPIIVIVVNTTFFPNTQALF